MFYVRASCYGDSTVLVPKTFTSFTKGANNVRVISVDRCAEITPCIYTVASAIQSFFQYFNQLLQILEEGYRKVRLGVWGDLFKTDGSSRINF